MKTTVFSAPKARNVIAQGNALGKGHINLGSAEGAKQKSRLKTSEDFAGSIFISRLQR
jgi:hypothetical protein